MIKKLGSIHQESYNKNVLMNYLFKGASIVLGLVSTRLILGYLGTGIYGLWVTITSVISWLNSGDLGIGNGLRNELAKAFGENNIERQRMIVSASISAMIKVAAMLLLVIIIVSEILFKANILVDTVRCAMYITSAFFCINLVLGISQSIALAYQKSWLTTMTSCGIQLFLIVSVMVMDAFNIPTDLNQYAIINGICSTIPNIILIAILKRDSVIQLSYVRDNIDKQTIQSIMNTGIKFFGIQICAVVLYQTDSLIINKIISSEMVTKYDLITKIYNTGNNLFSILLIALWSAVTYHIAQNNIVWIKRKVKQLILLWIVYTFGVLCVSLLFNNIIVIWLGKDAIEFEWQLIALFAISSSLVAFSSIFVNVLNGMGVIKLQLILALFEAIINIPLSIFFAKGCMMGIFGVKLATFVCTIITSIIMPVQALVEIRRKEKIIR